MDPPLTLPETLLRTAERRPDKGIAIFDGRGRNSVRHTYPEVLERARLAASRLAAAGVSRGDCVVISLSTTWDLVDSWLGAVMLGALPVNAAPLGVMGTGEKQLERLAMVIERIEAGLLLCHEALLRDARQLGLETIVSIARTPEDLATIRAKPVEDHRPDPSDLAYLQLTSGSTGVPRAVAISHASAVHNPRACEVAIGKPHGRPAGEWVDSCVSWLPLHHDMGLVGCFLLNIQAGIDTWLFSPKTFLARPQVWLRELGRHGVTASPAPNFAFQTCVERVEAAELEDCDLSGWKAAMVGAEMVRARTLEQFASAFTGLGYSPRSALPCYGLAEATLAVTFDSRGKGVRTRMTPAEGTWDGAPTEVACVGEPIIDTEVAIVSPDGAPLEPGRVGVVRVRGPGLFAGYYNDDEATAESLVDGWLDTGDLGFMADGELYLTGRVKDLIIVRGQNVMPHVLEECAEAVSGGGGTSRSGAFAIDAGEEGEQPVVVVEVTDTDAGRLAGLEREIRVRIGRSVGLPLADVAFVRRGKIPKTTSGKVQRARLRELYLKRELERLETAAVAAD